MELAKTLAQFSQDELQALADRWNLDLSEKPKISEIVGYLTSARILAAAFFQIDSFQLALFRWISDQPGNEAPWSSLSATLGQRVTDDYLNDRLQDLRLWGLIDFHVGADGGFIAAHEAAVRNAPGREDHASAYLGGVPVGDLAQVARHLQIKRPPAGKAAVLRVIMEVLTDGDAVRRVIDTLPLESQKIFQWVLERGEVSTAELTKRPGGGSASTFAPFPSYYTYGQKADPLGELVGGLLLLPRGSPGAWRASSFVVPTEVLHALNGTSVFDEVPLRPPGLAEASSVKEVSSPNPLFIVRDIGHLMGFVASGRCEWRQDREPYQRSLDALSKMLKNPDKKYANLLWLLSDQADLVRQSGTGYSKADIGNAAPTEVYEALLTGWVSVGTAGHTKRRAFVDPPEIMRRGELVHFLRSLPPDTWITTESILEFLRFDRPLLFGNGASALTEWSPTWAPLDHLLISRGTTPSQGGAILVRSDIADFLANEGRAQAVFLPDWDQQWVIQPDRTITAPPNVHPVALADAWELAQLEDNQGASIFRITAESVARALNRGETPGQIRKKLQKRSKTKLPATVERLLSDQEKRYGQIRIGAGQTFVKAEDPTTIEELMRDRKLAHLKWSLLAPGVATVENAPPQKVLEALRKIGHLPVLDAPTAGAGGHGSPDPRTLEMLRKLTVALGANDAVEIKWKEHGHARRGSFFLNKIVGMKVYAENVRTYDREVIEVGSVTEVNGGGRLDDIVFVDFDDDYDE